ncbi:Ldh family oxidoreductase [Actinobacteria bacterium YIM 96077]|uniref:Ldh family oxidoreductase n=1 Tax=Phytoactinopolyspora halophila TaxID=1981511 RepID=A0A329QP81_9ACTN|nr:Ldh family oxidoreductase [Phytoactinopolyspora halophila]AYY15047.1 Ldh family oxidoreductase [Actinobacteria bacterium YIM 96077]RAW14187.1 Ldh family oxidoreductase [Phytoactinopolyspora halophila]
MTTVPYVELETFAAQCLTAAGASQQDAQATASLLTRTDAFGIHSHGLKNLAGYLEKSRRGAIDLTARPTTEVDGPAFALLDAHHAIGMVSGTQAMRTATEKAREAGIAVVAVHSSTHFGAAGLYALMAAEDGLIGLTASNVDPNMTVPGARGKVLGNNPIAYALPAGRHRPVVFDISLSAVASLKVIQAREDGAEVPEGWIVDGAGRPTTDPSRYPGEGAMMPMAGHKGYGLALLVDALTGLLANAATSDQVPSWYFEMDRPNDVSHAFLAIDPSLFGGSPDYAARVESFLDRIHAAPLADGAEEIRHPGQLEWRNYEKARDGGLSLPPEVVTTLETAGHSVGVRPPWV